MSKQKNVELGFEFLEDAGVPEKDLPEDIYDEVEEDEDNADDADEDLEDDADDVDDEDLDQDDESDDDEGDEEDVEDEDIEEDVEDDDIDFSDAEAAKKAFKKLQKQLSTLEKKAKETKPKFNAEKEIESLFPEDESDRETEEADDATGAAQNQTPLPPQLIQAQLSYEQFTPQQQQQVASIVAGMPKDVQQRFWAGIFGYETKTQPKTSSKKSKDSASSGTQKLELQLAVMNAKSDKKLSPYIPDAIAVIKENQFLLQAGAKKAFETAIEIARGRKQSKDTDKAIKTAKSKAAKDAVQRSKVKKNTASLVGGRKPSKGKQTLTPEQEVIKGMIKASEEGGSIFNL